MLELVKAQQQTAKAQQTATSEAVACGTAQERLLAASSALAIINPGLPALVLGRPEAVVTKTEVVEKTVLVNDRGVSKVSFEGISKTKLASK